MNRNIKMMGRRKFLKTGIFGGAIAAVFPRGQLLDSPLLHSGTHIEPEDHSPSESSERLLQIACTYGPEFGEIKEIEYGCI